MREEDGRLRGEGSPLRRHFVGYKMDDTIFSNLGKLLLQLVFQTEQVSYSKEHVTQQIQIYTANIVREKSEICHLQEDINKNDEVILSLHKRNSNTKENCKTWKPTYIILNKHEEYLQKELQKCQEATEKDKKIYQDNMKQFEETFKQHQAKYLETAAAQEYYRERKEFEVIQSRVRKQSELLKQKEAEVMDLQDPGPFPSLTYWASQIASLRQSTKGTLKNAAVLRQQSFELDKTAEELENKINSFKQQLERMTEDQNHPEVIDGGNANNLETRKKFEESSFKKSHQLHLLNEKHRMYKPLHLPNVSQKLVQSVPTLKPSIQHTQTDVKRKEDSAGHSGVSSTYFSYVGKEIQKCNDTTGTKNAKTSQVSCIRSLQNQTPLRLLSYQKQTNNEQWFEVETPEIAEKDVECTRREEGNKSEHSVYVSQDGQTECYIKPTGHNSAVGEDPEHFPEPNVFLKTPDFSGANILPELLQTESEGSVSKSPAFSFLMGFATKSPGFNFFDSTEFGAESSPVQTDANYSAGNVNPASPHKDIGGLFGKMDTEDSFAFSFPSCSSGQAFQDGKDDFSFPFAFGSSQPEPASVEGFQSSVQSRKTFSLF
ncbi:protein SIX6OS1 isoform X2 [Hemicordylus capensis]|uniref:protein SIX6OS1 isoform X2 n=1 Tax=Hemicordylus capensis TaxID=884348 RepID=UPI0023021443|nr:protein SIX6OS1 isoform X2 [Hemicordylus capensis]